MKRTFASLVAGGVVILGCSTTERVGGPDMSAPVLTLADREKVNPAIANSGCTAGRAVGSGSAFVALVPQQALPFKVPKLTKVPLSPSGRAVYRVQKFAKMNASGEVLQIACIIPWYGSRGAEVDAAIAQTSFDAWAGAMDRVGAKLVNEVPTVAIVQELAVATFPKHRSVGRHKRGGGATRNEEYAKPIRGMTVYAGSDHAVLMWFLHDYSDEPSWYDVNYDEEWAQACESWNTEYWRHQETKGQAEAAIQALRDFLRELQDANDEAENSFATATGFTPHMGNTNSTPCDPTGKKICAQAWIRTCSLANGMGDCRDADATAHASQSRIELEIDPDTRTFTYKYSGSMIAFPCASTIVTGGLPILSSGQVGSVCYHTFKDSARFAPAEAITLDDYGANGFTVNVRVKTSACALFPPQYVAFCPAIDMKLGFPPDASKPCGFDPKFHGDAAPSWAIYCRTGYNQFQLMRKTYEPAGVKKFGGALMGLNRIEEQLPGPPEAPEGCYAYRKVRSA